LLKNRGFDLNVSKEMGQISIILLLPIILSLNVEAQSFKEFISTVPKLSVPVKWSETNYLSWPEIDLPQKLFATAGIDSYSGKALATINLGSHYLILVKEYYSYKNDFFIYGLLFKSDGIFIKLMVLRNAKKGGDKNFYVGQDLVLKIMTSYDRKGSLSTFIIQNDKLMQQGAAVFYNDAIAFMKNEDND